MTSERAKKIIQKSPATIGVYLFYRKNKPIYIGKAINIRARLKSHLENAKHDWKEAAIIEQSQEIKTIATENEFQALILEARLIKKHLPRYNVIWRDGKSYLYIKITKEIYPKVLLTRKENDKKSFYAGPFGSVRVAERLLREIRRVVPFCTAKKITTHPCFYSKIGLCDPCPNAVEREKDERQKKQLTGRYRKNIQLVKKILGAKTQTVADDLRAKMKNASAATRFEEALLIRNRITRFEQLINERNTIDEEQIGAGDQKERALASLGSLIKAKMTGSDPGTLERIECYDISNTNQKEITAAMVVAMAGQIDKGQYRKFKIKNNRVRSDFQALEEVLGRRLKRTDWGDPDLIVVDGGKPQVRVILKAVRESNNARKPWIIGIAKNPDRIIVGTNELATIRPNPADPGFRLIQQLRDEAHRFSKKYHTALRDKKFKDRISA